MKALEKDRSRRYETANGLAMDVQRYLADEAVQACPPSARYRLSKFARKYKKALVMAAAFAVILVAGLVASTLLAVWARSAEREATRHRITADAAKQEAVAQANQAEKNFAEAQGQRAQAVALLYRSLIGEARAIREARGSGYRALAWKRLEQALRLETPQRDLTELRREAGACLGDFVGLEPTDSQPPAKSAFYGGDLHPGGELLAIVVIGPSTSGQFTSEVLLRNVVSGQEVGRLQPKRGLFLCVKFSADGKELFTGEVNGVVGVWQLDAAGNWHRANAITVVPESSAFVSPFPRFPTSLLSRYPAIAQLAVSQDGSLLAAFGQSQLGGTFSLWNLADGKLAPEFHAAGAPSKWASMLRSVAFSPRGDLMAAGLAGGNMNGVLVWDVATRELRRTLRPEFGEVYHVSFSVDGKYLACACREGLVLFNTADFERYLFARAGGPWGRSWTSAFSPDSSLLAIPAPEAGLVRRWNITTNHELTVPIDRDPAGPPFVGFTRDGKRLVSAGNQSVRIWNLAGALEKQALSGHSGGIPGLAFSPDGKLLVSSGKDHIVRFWDHGTGKIVRELRGLAATPQCVAFSPGGEFLATTEYYQPGAVKLWDARSGEQISTDPENVGPGDFGAAFSRDGKRLVVCGQLGVKLWDIVGVGRAEDGRPRWSFKEAAHPERTATGSVCLSPDGRFFAWTSGRQVSVCEEATGQMHSWPVNIFRILALSFLPDGKHLVLVNRDTGKIELRDASDGQVKAAFGRKELFQGATLGGHETIHGSSIHTALSPDGAWLAVGGDAAVTVWDLNRRELLFALPEERGTIWSMAWSPDKNLLAVGSSHGGLTIWHVPRIKSELSRIGLGW
jgi:WD40 repeat protein